MGQTHIGKKIQTVFALSACTMVDFTKKIGVDRQVGYDIFKRKSINTDLLFRISKSLNHDFFKYYSKTLKIKKPKENF